MKDQTIFVLEDEIRFVFCCIPECITVVFLQGYMGFLGVFWGRGRVVLLGVHIHFNLIIKVY